MSINSNIPQIVVLRERVEARYGKALVVHSDFLNLVADIEFTQRQHISESTLERVWGYSTRGYNTVSKRTLDVLAHYVGAENWDKFCQGLQEESMHDSEFLNDSSIISSDLQIGARLYIGWQPDRLCEIRYLGENRFIAEKCQNSIMQCGDTFSCLQFTLGKELIMCNFCQGGSVKPYRTYVVGQRNGLSVLKQIE